MVVEALLPSAAIRRSGARLGPGRIPERTLGRTAPDGSAEGAGDGREEPGDPGP